MIQATAGKRRCPGFGGRKNHVRLLVRNRCNTSGRAIPRDPFLISKEGPLANPDETCALLYFGAKRDSFQTNFCLSMVTISRRLHESRGLQSILRIGPYSPLSAPYQESPSLPVREILSSTSPVRGGRTSACAPVKRLLNLQKRGSSVAFEEV